MHKSPEVQVLAVRGKSLESVFIPPPSWGRLGGGCRKFNEINPTLTLPILGREFSAIRLRPETGQHPLERSAASMNCCFSTPAFTRTCSRHAPVTIFFNLFDNPNTGNIMRICKVVPTRQTETLGGMTSWLAILTINLVIPKGKHNYARERKLQT